LPDEISRDVNQFIHDHIPSVEKLEVLLLLMEHTEHQWSATQVAQKLYRQATSVAAHLDVLHKDGLLTHREDRESLYRYAPSSGSTDLTVRALDRAYRERKDAVISLIFSRPPDTLRSFSDAFRIRKPG
jgi:predicted ArsR family transcriptional regulator